MAENINVNEPASGSFGEKADLNRLKASLPSGAIGTGPPSAPQATPMSPEPTTSAPTQIGRPPTGAAAVPGIPAALLTPTAQPDVPVATPLQSQQQDPMAGVQTAAQGRLAVLYHLSTSPDVSPATRQWANHVIAALLGHGG